MFLQKISAYDLYFRYSFVLAYFAFFLQNILSGFKWPPLTWIITLFEMSKHLDEPVQNDILCLKCCCITIVFWKKHFVKMSTVWKIIICLIYNWQLNCFHCPTFFILSKFYTKLFVTLTNFIYCWMIINQKDFLVPLITIYNMFNV